MKSILTISIPLFLSFSKVKANNKNYVKNEDFKEFVFYYPNDYDLQKREGYYNFSSNEILAYKTKLADIFSISYIKKKESINIGCLMYDRIQSQKIENKKHDFIYSKVELKKLNNYLYLYYFGLSNTYLGNKPYYELVFILTENIKTEKIIFIQFISFSDSKKVFIEKVFKFMNELKFQKIHIY